MTMLYRTQVTHIGEYAADALDDNMMILFNDNAPADVADYCFIHPRYPITAVGDVVNQNLAELGHITIRFDGGAEAEYPGTVHVAGKCPEALVLGTELIFQTE